MTGLIKKTIVVFALTGVLVLGVEASPGDTLKFIRKGYVLTLINQDQSLKKEIVQNLVETFFIVYPVLVRSYNMDSPRNVIFLIDTTFTTGITEGEGNKIRISNRWLKKRPDDFDVVTHEVMHLVQSYPEDAGPWWIKEGIADYVRYVNGWDNPKGGWFLPEYNESQNYDDGFRITARFFVWIENTLSPGFIKRLDHAMRTGTYSDKSWKDITGKTLNELWIAYGANPAI